MSAERTAGVPAPLAFGRAECVFQGAGRCDDLTGRGNDLIVADVYQRHPPERTMKPLIAAAITAALLVGCGQLPAPSVTCEDVPTTECQAAHQVAVTNGLFLEGGAQVLAATVRRTEYRFCNQDDEPLFDVSFQLRERSGPLVVSVGRAIAGSLVVCTY